MYGETLQKIVDSPSYVRQHPDTVDATLKRLNDYTERTGLITYATSEDDETLPQPPDRFSCLYATPKLHKRIL